MISPKYLKEQVTYLMRKWLLFYRGPYAVLEQSDGFGKTKACLGLVDEEFYVVYCCLCEDDSHEYPKRSCLADRFFSNWNTENFYACYFNSFIDLLNTTEISCKDFYEKYSQRLDGSDSPIVKKLIKSQFQNSSDDPKISFYKGSKPLIFIFDEASSLLKVNRQYEGTYSYFDIMRFLLPKLEQNVFVLFVNMFNISNNFDAKREPDPDLRIAYGSLNEFEPICLLPNWDLFADQVKIEKIADSVKIENICKYGRPLWSSLLLTKIRQRKKCDSSNYKELYDFAINKLTFGKMTESLNSIDILAVLSCRIGTIKPKSISSCQDLVAHNMATSILIKNSEYIYDIAYPSEPILAESAAFLMGAIGYIKIVESLIESFKSSLISNYDDKKGLIAKLIILNAKDQASRRIGANEPFLYLNVVKVGVFLQKLYGKCHANCGCEQNNWLCSSENSKCIIKLVNEQLQDTTKLMNGYINFNHFFQSKKNMSEQPLLPALKRCAAIECKQNENSINFVIPVCLNKENFKSISAIMVKVKLDNNPNNIEHKSYVQYAFTEMSDDFNPYKGFLVLYMQFGTSKNKTTFISSLKSKKDHEFNKYQAIIYSQGISREIFPILESGLDEKLVTLSITEENLFSDDDIEKKKIYDSYFSL
ncbi:unnamed protein product [Brachionus calyciflorus]|uniref:Uncharacterized protein n=1 Tax=Brachionus calyciflorus TaxID=104777 RepID=A0A813M4Y0_9BILA|nr:unnamed protein product [Brachionus calyciflorus]